MTTLAAQPAAVAAVCLLLLVGGLQADSSSSSSSSSSSDDDEPSPADVMEAAVQECVRKHEPPMISGGDYSELAKITTCVSDGMEALGAGTAPAAVEKQIEDCVNGKPFPDSLKPTVDAFLACVRGVLL
ncbi:uncharacterized protein LOC113216907 [Frankliniella occidentalis]|uniref:Uncharacterized protein LOC113216907 n=1 Tax=Frankliniella occidentalis TaxID=133901 RepID=A0A6J1TLJ8_FRAOC|nr:uncharacterized protein LOC113216907 [Frankliniella occidentalis]